MYHASNNSSCKRYIYVTLARNDPINSHGTMVMIRYTLHKLTGENPLHD